MEEAKNCAQCSQEIKDKQSAVVDGKNYHVECFVCGECKTTLGGKKFFKKEGGVYCETCNLEKFAPTCGECQKKIQGKHLVVEDKKYHHSCFVCHSCSVPFNTDGYYKEDDQLICKKCLTLKKNRECVLCKELIEENEIFALGGYFHPDCFKCHKCEKVLVDHTFINIENNAYHQECVNTTCIVCGGTCDGEYYEVENSNICHTECIGKYDPKVHTEAPQKVTVTVVNQEPEQKAPEPVKEAEPVKAPEPEQTQQPVQPTVSEPEQKEAQSEPQAPVQAPAPVEETKEAPAPQPQQPAPAVNTVYQLKTMDAQDTNSIDPSCLDPNRPRYPYADLIKNPPPAGVPLNKKELFLSDEEFEKLFKMKINRFLALKEWKRTQIKKQHNLF